MRFFEATYYFQPVEGTNFLLAIVVPTSPLTQVTNPLQTDQVSSSLFALLFFSSSLSVRLFIIVWISMSRIRRSTVSLDFPLIGMRGLPRL